MCIKIPVYMRIRLLYKLIHVCLSYLQGASSIAGSIEEGRKNKDRRCIRS